MAMTFQAFSIILAILEMSISISMFSVTEANSGGFSVDLIHRDSPKSPLYNHSLTTSQRMNNALRRSFSRNNHFLSRSKESVSTDVFPSPGGAYLMKISIGTPPVQLFSVADTGSDITWIQCSPCTHCYKQNYPLFNPNSSSSYESVPCGSETCQAEKGTYCLPATNACQYSASYFDKSFSYGELAIETVRFGSTTGHTISFPNIVIGCGHDSDGAFNRSGTSGIVGLGGGPISLTSQISSSIGGKFSYCLVPYDENTKSSKLNFGDNGVVSGSGVVSTPIFEKFRSVFYFLTLEGISVGEERLDFYNFSTSSNASMLFEDGNIFIDSGTTLSFLPPDLFLRLQSAVERAIKLQPILAPENILSLCYYNLKVADVPIITAHFKGADVKLKPVNTFVRISDVSTCLAFAKTQTIPIFGNVAQANHLVGYDLQKKTVSFKHTDCTKH